MADGGRLPFCLSFLSASIATSSAVAGGGRAVGDLAVDDAPRVVVVGARRLHGVGRVGEGDGADAHLRRAAG